MIQRNHRADTKKPGRNFFLLLTFCFPAAVFFLLVTAVRPSHAASITVNTNADDSTSGDALCTLREAITNANSDSDTTGGDCTAGSGTDTISFDGSVFNTDTTITLTDGALPTIIGDLTIEGSSNVSVSIDGNAANRIFYADSGANLTLANLIIVNGSAGSGAGLYIDNAEVTITDSTFSRTTARSTTLGYVNKR